MTGAKRRASPSGTGTGLRGCPRPLAEAYDVALLDLDGVVYVGAHAVPGAADALAAAERLGMRRAYVTNNASRTPARIAAHLHELGVPARPEEVVTSAQAAAHLLADRLPAGSPVLVVGGEGLVVALGERGLRAVSSLEHAPLAVVQGFHPDVGWRMLAEATAAVRSGLPWLATNLDQTVPTPRGPAPGNGALVDVVRGATGAEPEVAGKPELPLHREAADRSGARRPLVVGDRLDTDVEGAARAGTDCLLVLTGVTTPRDLLAAPAGRRPTYVDRDLTGLLRPHPEVSAVADGVCCGGWVASIDARSSGGRAASGKRAAPGRAEILARGPEPMDGLRALCAAVWAVDAEVDAEAALAGLGL